MKAKKRASKTEQVTLTMNAETLAKLTKGIAALSEVASAFMKKSG